MTGRAPVERCLRREVQPSVDLLPASLDKLEDAPKGKDIKWEQFKGSHALMKPFVEWSRKEDPDFTREGLWPFVRRYGEVPTNPSALPNDYTRGLLIVLAAVWLVAVALLVHAGRSIRRRG